MVVSSFSWEGGGEGTNVTLDFCDMVHKLKAADLARDKASELCRADFLASKQTWSGKTPSGRLEPSC